MKDLLNSIDNMPGPEFLGLYGIVVVVTLGGCWLWRLLSNPTRNLSLPPIPKDPDPYAVAYLRGEENEVVRLAVFRLLQHGYLEFPESVLIRKLVQSPNPPDKRPELLVERLVLAYFTGPRVPGAIFNDLSMTVQGQCNEYRRQFERENLITTPRMRAASLFVGLTGAAIILGLGGFKLLDAIDERRSFWTGGCGAGGCGGGGCGGGGGGCGGG